MTIKLSEISNLSENSSRYIHFSIDDVSASLKDINTNKSSYSSLFDNPLFQDIKILHKKYNACFTLYLFGMSKLFDVSYFTPKFDNELVDNSDWLKFGYHGIDDFFNENDSFFAGYDKFIKRFESVPQLLTDTLRIHRWNLTQEAVSKLKETGIKCLLTADRKIKSYDLTQEQADELYMRDVRYNGILYKKTDLRIERIILPTYRWLPKYEKQTLVIFTHEYMWDAKKVESVFRWLKSKRYSFVL
jgi:hypothetical protein